MSPSSTLAVALATCVAIASTTVAPAAHAGGADVSPVAEALFRDGRAAAQRGDYGVAVAKFAESQRIEPSVGTLLNLAVAEEKAGRIATAWEHARAVLDELDLKDNRRPTATSLFERLDARVPRLVLRFRGNAPNDVVVDRNGTALGAAVLGTPLPVEPGPQRITVRAAGHADARYTVLIVEGARADLEIALGAPLSGAPSDVPVRAREPAFDVGSDRSGLRTLGIAALVAGGVSLVVGTVTGGLAIARSNEVDRGCDATGCDSSVRDPAREGRTFATASTVTLVTGIVLGGGGLSLVLLSSKRSAPVAVAPHGAGLRATVRF